MKNKGCFSLFLGIRNFYSLRKRKKRTMAGAAVAVALSIIPLIVVLEISDGMIEGITRRFIELETGHIQIVPFNDESLSSLETVSEQISEMEEVLYASPVYRGTALIYSDHARTGIQLKALPQDIIKEDAGFDKYLEIIEGSFDISEGNNIMLSREIAEQLKAGTGSTVKVLTGKRTSTGRLLVRPEEFIVKGIFSTGYYEVDSMSGYINLDKGDKLFRGDGFLSIQCKIENPYKDADKIAYMIQSEIDIDTSALSWYRMQRSMYESLHTTRVLLVFIMSIIVIVASVNITSSMIIMVIERQNDIAIIKSWGTNDRQIRASFLITGIITGITGTAAGTIAGVLISANINDIIKVFKKVSEYATMIFSNNESSFSINSAASYYLDEIPVDIDPLGITVVAVGAILLSLIAAIIPAKKAEHMMPIDIMKKH